MQFDYHCSSARHLLLFCATLTLLSQRLLVTFFLFFESQSCLPSFPNSWLRSLQSDRSCSVSSVMFTSIGCVLPPSHLLPKLPAPMVFGPPAILLMTASRLSVSHSIPVAPAAPLLLLSKISPQYLKTKQPNVFSLASLSNLSTQTWLCSFC